MSEDFSFEVPATFDMTVWVQDEEREVIGKVTISLAHGHYPTKEKIDAWVRKAMKETGMEVCTPHEFGRALLLEETGQVMAIPGPDEWPKDFNDE